MASPFQAMMHHFPNITRIQPLAKLRRVRYLPRAGRVIVGRGQQLTPVQVIGLVPNAECYHVLDASSFLGIGEDELDPYLLVEPGMDVEKGTPLMRKQRAFGRTILYRSPIAGHLDAVRHGCLVIIEEGNSFELRALMSATVAQVIPSRAVVLEAIGTLVDAIWDSGREGYGEIKMGVNGPEQALEEAPAGSIQGRIVVAGRIESLEALKQLEDGGVRGIIAGSMPANLCHLARSFTFPILLTDGIGKLNMAEPIFELLEQSQGRDVSLFPAENQRQVQKPQIMIPLPTSFADESLTHESGTMVAGKRVRVLGLQASSAIGTVDRVYPGGKRATPNGQNPGADVQLADGNLIYAPFTNLELLA